MAVSQDGSTLLVGGPGEGAAGAAWVFTNVGGVWTQQGGKLAPTNPVRRDGELLFGDSVALSADGNVALIGAPFDTEQRPPGRRRLGLLPQRHHLVHRARGSLPNNAIIVPNDHGSFFGVQRGAVGRRQHRADRRLGRQRLRGRHLGLQHLPRTQLQKADPPSDADPVPAPSARPSRSLNDGSTALIAGTDEGAVWAFTRSGSTWMFSRAPS